MLEATDPATDGGPPTPVDELGVVQLFQLDRNGSPRNDPEQTSASLAVPLVSNGQTLQPHRKSKYFAVNTTTCE